MRKGLKNVPLSSIFRARPKDPGELNESFAGTFFKTTYQGKEEVFGVIASHALTEGGKDFSLQRIFLADVYIDGSFVEVPMEVVQLGAPGMLDVSLVKIPDEIIPFIEPYELMPKPPVSNEPFASFGFVGNELKQVENRYVLNHRSSYSMRTMMPTEPGSYVGECGGPLEGINENGVPVLAGIHTGSSGKVGYAASAHVLNMLVEAYHHQGEGYFPLEFNGYQLAQLRADEYISFITLYNKQGQALWKGAATERFSTHFLAELLFKYHPHTLQLTLGRAGWANAHSMDMREQISVRKVRYEIPEDFLSV